MNKEINVKIIKKDGTMVKFQAEKIINAISKSAERVMVKLTQAEEEVVINDILSKIENNNMTTVGVAIIHNMVESALDKINGAVANSYREYRNYKQDFVKMFDEVYQKAQSIEYRGDKSNSNTDSSLVSTQRSIIYGELNKELYNKFFLNVEEKQACRDGFIYIHDKSSRRDTMNCCLFDTKKVMTGGFEMGNMWYNEPNSIDTACDVLGDIIMMSASMQYGGWSTRIDDLLAPYCEKSYNKYIDELVKQFCTVSNEDVTKDEAKMAQIKQLAFDKTIKDLEQGVQGLEYKLNSVASSRGDYPSR